MLRHRIFIGLKALWNLFWNKECKNSADRKKQNIKDYMYCRKAEFSIGFSFFIKVFCYEQTEPAEYTHTPLALFVHSASIFPIPFETVICLLNEYINSKKYIVFLQQLFALRSSLFTASIMFHIIECGLSHILFKHFTEVVYIVYTYCFGNFGHRELPCF